MTDNSGARLPVRRHLSFARAGGNPSRSERGFLASGLSFHLIVLGL